MKAIVLTFDRFALSFLGGYGNQWIETPNFDRLTAQAVVFDQHFVETAGRRQSLGASGAVAAWWSGRYQFLRTRPDDRPESILSALRDRGVATWLLAEDDSGNRSGMEAEFDNVETVVGQDGLDVDHATTPFAKLIARAVERLGQLPSGQDESWLLWLKSRGVPAPWIPPRVFATLYLDELVDGVDDPEGRDALMNGSVFAGPDKTHLFGGEVDSDDAPADSPRQERLLTETQRQVSRAVYAGYVTLLDSWLGKLLSVLEDLFKGQPLLLIATAGGGDSLGESGADEFGICPMGEPLVHVPLIARCFDAVESGSRRQSLAQTVDLAPTLLDWFQLSESATLCEGQSLLASIRGESGGEREYAYLGDGEGHEAIRTTEFYLVREPEAVAPDDHRFPKHACLFIKPDDIWEVHDVANQYPEQVELLSGQLDRFLTSAKDGGS